MDKVWFKLRQTHYTPGPERTILSNNQDDVEAPICLGHCVPDLKNLDFPINRGAIVPFPTRMKVFRTQSINFNWDDGRSFGTGLSLATSAPIAAMMGLLNARASVGFAFKKSLAEHEEYEQLDTYIVQPTRSYVEQCLQTEPLKRFLSERKVWSFFIVTGIRVARVGKRQKVDSKRLEVLAGPGVEVPVLASAELTANATRDHSRCVSETHVSDFVWAIRLAKVNKGLLMKNWSVNTFSRRATFAEEEEEEEVDLCPILEDEGVSDAIVIEDDELGEAVVMNSSAWTE